MSKQAVPQKKQAPKKQQPAGGQKAAQKQAAKKPAPKKQSAQSRAPASRAKAAAKRTVPSAWTVLLWLVPFYFIFVLSANGAVTVFNIFMAAAVAILLVARRSKIDLSRLNWQFVFVLLYILFAGISCFYAGSGRLALKEFSKLLLSFCVYLFVILFSKRGKDAGRSAAFAASGLAAVISFLSIDQVSTRWFSGAFLSFTSSFTTDYSQNGLEAGTRILSILEDPNVFAGVAGIGILLALGLALSSTGKERGVHLVCLTVSALGFLLSFSIGASIFIVLSVIAFLFFLPREKRAEALLLLLGVFLLTVIGAFLCYKSVFDGKSTFSLVPLLCLVVESAALCALDNRVRPPLEGRIRQNRKGALIALLCIICLLVVYAAVGLNVSGPASLSAGEKLERAAYLPAGTYTAQADASGAVTLKVESQNEAQLIMHTSTELFSGAAAGASFQVPGDSEIVKFTFTADDAATLSSFTYSGTKSGSLRLSYKLLPGFIANRLQGLQKNENAIQRVEFWRSAVKLWKQSPVIGSGLGSYEDNLYSVSSFYYVTKYAHNHYLQLLADLGLIGLLLFVGILLLSGRMLLCARKKEDCSPLVPCLEAIWIFMVLQAVIQVDFSSHTFLLFAFAAFALMNVCTADSEDVKAVADCGPRTAVLLRRGAAVVLAVWAVLCCGNSIAASVVAGSSEFYGKMETAMRLDPLNNDSYMLSYISAAMADNNPVTTASAEKYAGIMKDRPRNFDPCYPAEYYFGQKELPQAFEALEAHLAFNRARSAAWQYAIDLLQKQDDGSAAFRSGVKQIAASLNDWDSQSMEKIQLTDANRAYLESIGETAG